MMKTILQSQTVGDLTNAVKDVNPSLHLVLLVITAAVVLAVYVTIFVIKVINQGKKIDKLPCEDRQTQIQKLEINTSAIPSMKEDIKKMLYHLLKDKLTATSSPISVTPEGEEVAKELKIREHIDANWDSIMTYIDVNSESKNAYDIQELCVDTASVSLEKLFLLDGVNLVKTYAFNNRTHLSSYGRLIGVIVRDRYFEAKGINKGEVDKYDPLLKK